MKTYAAITKILLTTFAVIAVTALLDGCTDRKTPAPPTAEEKRMNPTMLFDPYKAIESKDMPSTLPMTDEQKAYAVAITQMTIRVIQKQTTLDQTSALFGKGTYHVPKAPEQPITLIGFRAENFRMESISIAFQRKDEKSLWHEADLRFETRRNVSQSAYRMDLPTSFFEGMVKDKAFLDERPEGNDPRRVHVFQFHTALQGVNVKLQFETREDMSNLNDSYPKSFHYLKVTRQE